MESAQNNGEVAWSWSGRIALLVIPVLVYLIGTMFTLEIKESMSATIDLQTCVVVFGAWLLRIGGMCVGAISLYKVCLTCPTKDTPKWMAKIVRNAESDLVIQSFKNKQ